MKKIVWILLLILVILAGVMIAVPFVFKDKIKAVVVQKVNESVNAKVTYERFTVSLLKSFPDLNAAFSNVSVSGKGEFEDDVLFSFSELSARVDLMGLIKKEGVKVESLEIDQLTAHLLVTEEGNANWKIAKKTKSEPDIAEEPEAVDTTKSSLKFLMKNIRLNRFNFTYNSLKGEYLFGIHNANAALSGELDGSVTGLNIEIESPDVDFIMGKTAYIDSKPLQLSTSLLADLDSMKFLFKTDGSEINGLPLAVDGGFELPEKGMLFDLNFSVPNIEMDQLLAMLPGTMKKQVEKMDVLGMVNFNGKIEGLKLEKNFPKFDIRLNVKDGIFKYPDLPDEIKISEASASLIKPQGSMDEMVVGVEKFNMNVADNPLSLHAKFSQITSDPYMDVKVDGTIDLATLTKVFPLDGITLKGLLKADAAIKGNYSSVKAEDYTAFYSRGKIGLKNFNFKNKALPNGLMIENAAIEMRNQDLRIRGLEGKSGRSDFSLSGRVANFINYALGEGELQGRLVLTSTLIDVNEFMEGRIKTPKEKGVGETADSIAVEAQKSFKLPARMHLVFQSHIASLLYDKLDITAFKGKVVLKDQKLTLSGVGMNLLDGTLGLDGVIVADGRPDPALNFDLNVNGFDLPTAWRDISLVQKYLPFAQKTEGEFSTVMNVSSKLGNNLKMILSDITAEGNFSTKDVQLTDNRSITALNKVIQTNKLENLRLDDCDFDFEIKNGNLNLKPFNTAFANQPLTISGSYNLGGTLDFRLDANIKKQILSKNIQEIIAYVPGHESIKTIDVGIDIDGDIKKPDVKVDANKIKNQVIEQVRKSSKDEIRDAAKKLFDKFLN
ncbi:MAG: AsmA family protein [Prolixibacteraceae bacterium]|nr:AsmA family protein [Prolixibacteraceae bacterium]